MVGAVVIRCVACGGGGCAATAVRVHGWYSGVRLSIILLPLLTPPPWLLSRPRQVDDGLSVEYLEGGAGLGPGSEAAAAEGARLRLWIHVAGEGAQNK